jgi:hypothetical protein
MSVRRRVWCVSRAPEHPQVIADVARHDAAGNFLLLLVLLLLEAGQLPHPCRIGWVVCVQVRQRID